MSVRKVLAHIVLFNSPATSLQAVESLLAQELSGRIELTIRVTDNASTNEIPHRLREQFGSRIELVCNHANIGFAAAQNQGAAECLKRGFDFLCLVNPDSRWEPGALLRLCDELEKHQDMAGATPLLYRADEQMNPCQPARVDAAGMFMTTALRHLDYEELPRTSEVREVFGGTGAALLLRSQAIRELALDCPEMNHALYRIYPELEAGAKERVALFDEAFFAYREDADLAWRARILGFGFIFVPDAVGYHIRHVLPERRAQLSPLINRWSVRNRFLMQLNNFSFRGLMHCVVPGLIGRNMLVIAGVLLREWSSVRGLVEVFQLAPRALARRYILMNRPEAHPEKISRWFGNENR